MLQQLSLSLVLVGTLALGLSYATAWTDDSSAGRAPASAPASVDLAKKPVYWRDPRLEKLVTVPPPPARRPNVRRPMPLLLPTAPGQPPDSHDPVHVIHALVIPSAALMNQVRQDTGAEILLRGDWQREAVVVPRQPTPARELMDDLQTVFGGRWFQEGTGWVLAENAEEARLTALPAAQREKEAYGHLKALFASINPAQWDLLLRTGELRLGQMDQAQRQRLLAHLQLLFFDPNGSSTFTPGPTALQGDGVYLAFTGSGKDCAFSIVAPMPHDTYMAPYPLLLPDGKPEFGIRPPR